MIFAKIVLSTFLISPAFTQAMPLVELQKRFDQWKKFLDDKAPVFAPLADFIRNNPDWPRLDDLKRKLEASLTFSDDKDAVIQWFDQYPPVTIKGATIYIKALIQKGRHDRAAKLIKTTWYEQAFSKEEFEIFRTEFKDHLTVQDHNIRLNNLLSYEKLVEVRQMLSLVNKQLDWLDKPQRDLALARIAMIENKKDSDKAVSEATTVFKNEPGLLYEKIKWLRKNKKDCEAYDMFKSEDVIGAEKSAPDLWWVERNFVARRLIEQKDYQRAYEIIDGHKLTDGENYVHAEWMASWLLITFLKNPNKAYDRLYELLQKVKMPISIARIAFWLGEASSKINNIDQAIDWYTKASEHPGTYYGQLAIARLNGLNKTPANVSLFIQDAVGVEAKQRFNSRDFVMLLNVISNTEKPEHVEPFFFKLGEMVNDPDEYRFLVITAGNISSPSLAVRLAKKSPKNMIYTLEAYPIIEQGTIDKTVGKLITNDELFPTIVYALIRQESNFQLDAVSPAGAQGLMQLMINTAKETAEKLTFLCKPTTWSPEFIRDPFNNLSIGSSYFKNLIDKYKGSLPLAIAAYNAGPNNVDAWLPVIGDPLNCNNIDMITWIELIPFGETRNYVQRVLENYMMYVNRAQQSGGVSGKSKDLIYYLNAQRRLG